MARAIGADAITGGPEVTWTQTPTKWSNHFFKNLFRKRMGADGRSPAGVPQWEGERVRKPASRTPHDKSKKHVPTMFDDRPVTALRPDLREDLAALLRASGPISRTPFARCVVQAHAPRHGVRSSANLGPLVPEGDADLAGPDLGPSITNSSTTGDIAALKAKDPRERFVGVATRVDRPGDRRRPSAAPTSAAVPIGGAHSPEPPEGLGR